MERAPGGRIAAINTKPISVIAGDVPDSVRQSTARRPDGANEPVPRAISIRYSEAPEAGFQAS